MSFADLVWDCRSSHFIWQYITQNDQEILRKYTFYHSLVVMIGISAVKISVGFFLLRVAGQTRFRKFIIGMLSESHPVWWPRNQIWTLLLADFYSVFLILFTSACAGTLIFQCIPVSAAWDLAERLSAKCFSMHMFMSIGLFNSCEDYPFSSLPESFLWLICIATAVNVATDVIFATLPIPMFYNVKVSKRTKASLMAILSLGYLCVLPRGGVCGRSWYHDLQGLYSGHCQDGISIASLQVTGPISVRCFSQ